MLNILDEVYSVYKSVPAVTFWQGTTLNPSLFYVKWYGNGHLQNKIQNRVK